MRQAEEEKHQGAGALAHGEAIEAEAGVELKEGDSRAGSKERAQELWRELGRELSLDGRRRRADAGQVRLTQRDLELLAFIGHQYAITQRQLERLAGVGERRARTLRARWLRAGWAESAGVLVGEPTLVWLTTEGLRLCELEYGLWRPTPSLVRHVSAVNEVRLLVAQRRPADQWVSERQLARAQERGEQGVRPGHRPDAVVSIEGEGEVAVEVELTQKKRSRAARIMGDNLEGYRSVWYFAAEGPARMLRELAAEQPGGQRVKVHPVPEESR